MPVETCCSQVRGFPIDHIAGVIFPLFSPRSSIFRWRTAGPRPPGGPGGFDFKIHWKQLAPSLPSPILFRSPLACTPTPLAPAPPGRTSGVVENKAGCLMKTLTFSTFHLLQINQTLDFFFFCNHAALNHGGRPAA